MATSDYFAELYVAGRFAEAGWNIYFPHRDQGFDFIVSKTHGGNQPTIRPVQVKGKYPIHGKVDKSTYGYLGDLSQVHDEMVLAIPFFSSASTQMPTCTAYIPRSLVRSSATRGFRCHPATFQSGRAVPRRDFKKFFDDAGLQLMESANWSQLSTSMSDA
ncbi:MAG TPA: hypothetical protein VG387_06780 [Rhizomicrobium sp.]|jgi:hypothetical protein|nr:hypothetical protein [Rhizomicrobium sp.]